MSRILSMQRFYTRYISSSSGFFNRCTLLSSMQPHRKCSYECTDTNRWISPSLLNTGTISEQAPQHTVHILPHLSNTCEYFILCRWLNHLCEFLFLRIYVSNMQTCLHGIQETYLVTVCIRTGQFLIRETVDVAVRPTEVAVASPSNSTLWGWIMFYVLYSLFSSAPFV